MCDSNGQGHAVFFTIRDTLLKKDFQGLGTRLGMIDRRGQQKSVLAMLVNADLR